MILKKYSLFGVFFLAVLCGQIQSIAQDTMRDDPSSQADDMVYSVASGPNQIFQEIFQKILKEAGIKFQFQQLDYQQLRVAFIEGDTDISCCSLPAWRNRPEEKPIQVFSHPFFHAVDLYALNPKVAKSGFDPSDTKLIFGRVKGWTYTDEIVSYNDKYYKGLGEILIALEKGEIDFALINRQEYLNISLNRSYNVVLGPIVTRIAVRVRVNKKYEKLLPKINAAIKKMRQDLTISKIIAEKIRSNAKKDTPKAVKTSP